MKRSKNSLFILLPLLLTNIICMAQRPLMNTATPGVYIVEKNSFPNAVAEVETAIPAFIGYTEKAKQTNDGDLDFVANKILSIGDYEKHYGGISTQQSFILYQSLQLYFDNGGNPCFIVSIGNYDSLPVKADFIKGLDIIEKKDEPTLLLFPEAINLSGEDMYEVQNAALKQAARLGDRFCIFDLKYADDHAKHDFVVNEFRKNIGPDNLKYGAAYSPYLKTSGNNSIVLPPSAAVAGQYCSLDRARGVWHAPANISLNGISQVVYAINENEQNSLNIDLNSGKSINAIRKFSGRGIVIWGARTLAGNDNEWRYISVRRFFNMVEETIKNACLPFVFEPNDANTWVKARDVIQNYLTLKWREGALAGSKPEEAFFVKVGLGQTMTATDILEGRMIVEIGMAVVRPAEFIIFRFSQKMEVN